MKTLLSGARVVDGTGAPAVAADVLLEGDQIVAVVPPGDAGRPDAVVNLDGLVLAPGFIDIHTHLDAQVLWDRDLTPSSWHGITTVVLGNCGFGIAPTRPKHHSTIARTLQRVEGMTLEALEAGIPWTFETFPQYLETVAGTPTRLNVGAFIGHTPLRLYTLGEEAMERAATEDEINTMSAAVTDAMRAGALGFSTSVFSGHVGADGRPVPSRLADRQEIGAIFDALASAGRGIVQASLVPGPWFDYFAELSAKFQIPVTWTGIVPGITVADSNEANAALERQDTSGGDIRGQISCRPLVVQFDLADPVFFATLPAFAEVLGLPANQRAAVYRDPAWRDRARPELAAMRQVRWNKATIQETTHHKDLQNGPSLAELAEQRHVDVVDLLCELALDDELVTHFGMVVGNDDEELLGKLLNDDRTLIGLSDAGAHANMLCDACYTSYLLQHWVRETQTLTLERAIYRLTGQLARAFRIEGRGGIAPGFAADLVAFDPDTVGAGPLERTWDFPAGTDRLVVQSTGIEHVWVNGVPIRRDGTDVPDARPGVLLRAGT